MSSLDQRLIAGNVPKIRKAGQVVATLDLGVTKIACLIVRTTDPSQGGFELLGYGQQSSRGLKNGFFRSGWSRDHPERCDEAFEPRA